MTQHVNETPVQRIQRLLGDQVVVVWMARGTKAPKFRGWQKQTVEHMLDARYVANLNSGHNLGVLVGAPSGGVCSIDIDDDASVEPFLALNPQLRGTLITRGKRGGNLWVKIRGQYPGATKIETRDGKAWGEWRSTGNQTVIHGVHPEGMEYRAVHDAPAIELTFGEIVWPDDVALPWKPRAEVPQDDSAHAELRRRFGDPVFISESKDGESSRVSGINEAYWAGLYAAENIALFEPNERTFYRYHDDSGLFLPESADAIKQTVSSRLLEVAREAEHLAGLERFRTDRTLNAITAQLRGIIEQRGAFAEKQRIVHLANGVIVFDADGARLHPFSPSFRSRNRSPIGYDPAATCPRFLSELVIPAVHADDVLLLQKMAGQCLLGVNLTQRLTLLDGLAGRGKTQYCIVIQKVVGHENVMQLRTQHLNERFELYRFLGRTLLVGVDVDENFLSSPGAPVIKGLVGGDWFDAEQKGGTGSFPFQGRFNMIIVSNSRLRVRLQGDIGACPVVTFRGWLAGRSEPDYFTQCAIVRQMRDGHDLLCDVRMSPVELTDALKCWRAKHGFTQREAAAAIGTSAETIRGWEAQDGVPRQPALGEILRRLRMPVDVELVKQATKRPRPIEPEKFAELMRAWRRRCKLSRAGAAYALRSVAGLKTTDRTIWLWESARALPRRPLAVLELIHGPIAVNPPEPPKSKPLIAPRQFATLLRAWRRTHCLTQLQACIALGLPRDQALISNWEKCHAFPRPERLRQLIEALKRPPASGPGTHNWFKARSHEFGQKLRAWRKARGLRQLDACAVLGLPRDQGLICRYERGEASPRRERMVGILAIIAGTEVQP